MFSLLRRLFGTANDRVIKKLISEAEKINTLEDEISKLSDENLRDSTKNFKKRLADGETLEDITYEAFAVVREASKRVLKMRHFDVQLVGGLVMHRGMVTEMRTGEGKTLVATLPAYLNALSGKGVHVVTPNDYLAQRDSESMGVLYDFLGLTVGCIYGGLEDEQRKKAYQCDITYATNNELGFDYLRDNMKFSNEEKVQRPFNFALIDEADSILIDEARTPLIISGPVADNTDLYVVIDKLINQVQPIHYDLDEKTKNVNFNDEGMVFVEKLLHDAKIMQEGTSLYDFENIELVHHVNQALKAHTLFKKDIQYLVQNNQVMIIDEFTGRIMDGRRFSDGLHQALEAKESVPIQKENQTLASITFQNFFRLYPKCSGMTGTAMTEAAELKDIYNLEVVSIPTHKPVKRIDHEDEIYGNLNDKNIAIVDLIQQCHDKGQPVLVGTVSIEKSEQLAELLKAKKIPHEVLNAKHHEKEAMIIAQAGRRGAVTIATNMAGRGTDIVLGGNAEMMIAEIEAKDLKAATKDKKIAEAEALVKSEKEEVLKAGGLFVLATERHESRRIDNQLRGRSGRQGDPGETKFFLSLEDDLMRIFASENVAKILRKFGLKDGEAIHHPMISRSLEKAQRKVESMNFDIRKNLLKFDDVMNDQRKIIYEQRSEVMSSENVHDVLAEMSEELAREVVMRFVPTNSYREDWDLPALDKEVEKLFALKLDLQKKFAEDGAEEEIIKYLNEQITQLFNDKMQTFGEETMYESEKYLLLMTLDQVWKEHLLSLDHLRQGIGLRAYGNKDPLNEYKREAFTMFESMLSSLRDLFVSRMAHIHIDPEHLAARERMEAKRRQAQHLNATREDPAFNKYNAGESVETKLRPVQLAVAPEDRDPKDASSWGKVSRNESCPCGSGKKYKHCHGAV